MVERIKILKSVESKELNIPDNELGSFLKKLESIGEGGNAVVSTWEGSEIGNICIKKIREIPVMRGNDLEREFDVQFELYENNISVPKPFRLLKNETGSVFYLMKRILGASIEDISAGKAKFPENFDMEGFFKKLEDEVKKMHKIGYLHRDLRSGNVMIDEKGDPVIIDFGTAIKVSDTENIGMSAYEESVTIYDPIKKDYVVKTGYFMDDIKESIPALKNAVKTTYWRSKGYRSTDQFGQEI